MERCLERLGSSLHRRVGRGEGFPAGGALTFRRQGCDDGRARLSPLGFSNPIPPASRWGAWPPPASATRLLLLQLLSRQLLSILLKNSSQDRKSTRLNSSHQKN